MEYPGRTILLTRAAGDWFRPSSRIGLIRGQLSSSTDKPWSFALSGGGGNQ